MPAPPPNPADLRMILARNLRRLTSDSDSISDLCRRIGVNRTQFNRYLSGMAFPRPDVLYRICSHFQVDANILLQDLTEIEAPAPSRAPSGSEVPLASQRPFDHYMLPDGLYQYWRKSFRQPRRAYHGMALISTVGTAKLWKGYDLHDQPIRAGGRRFARSTRYDGVLVQQFDGFALMSRTPYSDVMNMSYFEYGLDGLLDYYSGISFITRRRLPDTNGLTAIVMRRLPSRCADLLACARDCGSREISDLPPLIRTALTRVPDHI